MEYLVDALWTCKVLEAVLAEVEEGHALRRVVTDKDIRGLGHDDLPAVSGRHQAGTAIDLGPVIVAVPAIGTSGVQAHPDPDQSGSLPRGGAQGPLRSDGCRDPCTRGREDGEDAIAGVVDQSAVAALDRLPKETEVLRQCRRHGPCVGFPEASAALDVCKEERDWSGGGRSRHRIVR